LHLFDTMGAIDAVKQGVVDLTLAQFGVLRVVAPGLRKLVDSGRRKSALRGLKELEPTQEPEAVSVVPEAALRNLHSLLPDPVLVEELPWWIAPAAAGVFVALTFVILWRLRLSRPTSKCGTAASASKLAGSAAEDTQHPQLSRSSEGVKWLIFGDSWAYCEMLNTWPETLAWAEGGQTVNVAIGSSTSASLLEQLEQAIAAIKAAPGGLHDDATAIIHTGPCGEPLSANEYQ
jgi:hypothetical protein